MTRKEEIYKAARAYVSGILLSSPSDVIHFEYGAKWADEHPNLESLWHDASEEPTDNLAQILYHDIFDNCWLTTMSDILNDGWKYFAAVNLMSRWAYISDLLQKGGKR